MSNEFINAQVDKIVKDESYPYPLNIAMASTWIIGNLKGVNLKVLDVAKQSSLADYFVMGSATNSTMAKAMADEVIFQMKRAGHSIVSREGMASTADWILLDIGDIIVHIFLDSSRSAYDLDGLWNTAKHVGIPQDYYVSEEDDSQKPSGPDGRGFF
tara:strand:+ start:1307 stop:1777 length:471 start_codon:yes stop_codon:yes gene_type:complete